MSDPDSRNPNEPPDDQRTPFERFEDVLRKVVAVPKSEIDRKRRPRRP
jgi:hypothetical protein